RCLDGDLSLGHTTVLDGRLERDAAPVERGPGRRRERPRRALPHRVPLRARGRHGVGLRRPRVGREVGVELRREPGRRPELRDVAALLRRRLLPLRRLLRVRERREPPELDAPGLFRVLLPRGARAGPRRRRLPRRGRRRRPRRHAARARLGHFDGVGHGRGRVLSFFGRAGPRRVLPEAAARGARLARPRPPAPAPAARGRRRRGEGRRRRRRGRVEGDPGAPVVPPRDRRRRGDGRDGARAPARRREDALARGRRRALPPRRAAARGRAPGRGGGGRRRRRRRARGAEAAPRAAQAKVLREEEEEEQVRAREAREVEGAAAERARAAEQPPARADRGHLHDLRRRPGRVPGPPARRRRAERGLRFDRRLPRARQAEPLLPPAARPRRGRRGRLRRLRQGAQRDGQHHELHADRQRHARGARRVRGRPRSRRRRRGARVRPGLARRGPRRGLRDLRGRRELRAGLRGRQLLARVRRRRHRRRRGEDRRRGREAERLRRALPRDAPRGPRVHRRPFRDDRRQLDGARPRRGGVVQRDAAHRDLVRVRLDVPLHLGRALPVGLRRRRAAAGRRVAQEGLRARAARQGAEHPGPDGQRLVLGLYVPARDPVGRRHVRRLPADPRLHPHVPVGGHQLRHHLHPQGPDPDAQALQQEGERRQDHHVAGLLRALLRRVDVLRLRDGRLRGAHAHGLLHPLDDPGALHLRRVAPPRAPQVARRGPRGVLLPALGAPHAPQRDHGRRGRGAQGRRELGRVPVVPPRAEQDAARLHAPQQPVRRQAPARPRGAQGVLLGEAGPVEGPPGLSLY
ncbi:hypothetical protein AURANDRAFT_71404, partial [Aureococcus anophagefferens]